MDRPESEIHPTPQDDAESQNSQSSVSSHEERLERFSFEVGDDSAGIPRSQSQSEPTAGHSNLEERQSGIYPANFQSDVYPVNAPKLPSGINPSWYSTAGNQSNPGPQWPFAGTGVEQTTLGQIPRPLLGPAPDMPWAGVLPHNARRQSFPFWQGDARNINPPVDRSLNSQPLPEDAIRLQPFSRSKSPVDPVDRSLNTQPLPEESPDAVGIQPFPRPESPVDRSFNTQPLPEDAIRLQPFPSLKSLVDQSRNTRPLPEASPDAVGIQPFPRPESHGYRSLITQPPPFHPMTPEEQRRILDLLADAVRSSGHRHPSLGTHTNPAPDTGHTQAGPSTGHGIGSAPGNAHGTTAPATPGNTPGRAAETTAPAPSGSTPGTDDEITPPTTEGNTPGNNDERTAPAPPTAEGNMPGNNDERTAPTTEGNTPENDDETTTSAPPGGTPRTDNEITPPATPGNTPRPPAPPGKTPGTDYNPMLHHPLPNPAPDPREPLWKRVLRWLCACSCLDWCRGSLLA